MELVRVDYSASELRAMPVVTRARDLFLPVVLRPDDPVVLLGTDGEFHAARVAMVENHSGERIYHFDPGVRLPADLAIERINGDDLRPQNQAMHELLDLIGGLPVTSRSR